MDSPMCKTCLLWEGGDDEIGECSCSVHKGKPDAVMVSDCEYCELHQDWEEWVAFNRSRAQAHKELAQAGEVEGE